jgi:hypothetical protein
MQSTNIEALKKLIRDMAKVDQDLRLKAGNGHDVLNYMIYLADTAHNYRIHKIINDYSYPQLSVVGKEAMKDFWLLVQHQDYDVALQEAVLENCDFEPIEKAHLTDRVLMHKDKPQIYGTQFVYKDGLRVLYEVQDQDKLAERRKEAGLPPLEEIEK